MQGVTFETEFENVENQCDVCSSPAECTARSPCVGNDIHTFLAWDSVPTSIHLHFENTAKGVFLSAIATSDSNKHLMGGCTYALLPMLTKASTHSPLNDAIMAAGVKLAVLWGMRHPESSLPLRYYTRAVNSLRTSIEDEQRNRDDDVLMAVIIMDYFDSIDARIWRRPMNPLRSHRAGALALAKHRSRKNFDNYISKSMLVSVQNMAVEEALQKGGGINRTYDSILQSPEIPTTHFSSLNVITTTLAELLASSNLPANCGDSSKSCEALRQLDTRFELWHKTFIIDHNPRTMTGDEIPPFVQREELYRDTCNVYVNVEAANLANLWRCRRILLLTALQDCMIYSAEQDVELRDVTIEEIDTLKQSLADGICESIPFAFGDCNFNSDTSPDEQADHASHAILRLTLPSPKLSTGHIQLVTEGGGWIVSRALYTLSRLMEGTGTLRPLRLRAGQHEWIKGRIRRFQKELHWEM